MYPKNNASPEPIAIGAVIQISDGAVQTSGVTVRIKPKGVAEADGGGTVSYSTDGIVYYTPTQAETNYTSFILIAKKTGCFPVAQTIVTSDTSSAGQVKLAGETHTSAVIPTVTTTTNVTTVNGLASNVITAASIASAALNGKGDWNIGKTGYSLTQAFPANFASMAITVGGAVTVGTNNDKTGYSLTQAFPSNFASMAITGGGALTIGTNNDKTGYSLLATTGLGNQTANITGNLSGSVGSVTGAVGSVTAAVTVGTINSNAITAASIASAAITAAKFGSGAIDAAALAADAVAEIADGVWDEDISGHLTAGSTGAALNAAGSAGDPWSTPLPGAYGAGTAGKIVGDNINATISSRATQASVDTVDTVVDAVKVDTTNTLARLPAALVSGRMDASVGAMQSNVLTSGALDATASAEIADAVWDEATSGHAITGSTGEQIAQVSSRASQTSVNNVEADTQDIQSRLPTVLVSGRMDSYVGAMGANTVDGNAVASSAVAEIQSGLATSGALTTVSNNVDTILTNTVSLLSNTATLITKFLGITYLADWLRILARADADTGAMATARSELNDGIGTFVSNESLEGIRVAVSAGGGGGGGSTGSGQYAITFTVTNSVTLANLSQFRITAQQGGVIIAYDMVYDGNSTLNLDPGTYDILITPGTGYDTPAPASLVVSANAAVNYLVDPTNPTPPAAPGLCTVQCWFIDAEGNPKENVRLSAEMVDKNSVANDAIVVLQKTVGVSDPAGYVELQLIRLDQFKMGKSGLYRFIAYDDEGKLLDAVASIPNAASATLGSIV
jgi:hypothetical protein